MAVELVEVELEVVEVLDAEGDSVMVDAVPLQVETIISVRVPTVVVVDATPGILVVTVVNEVEVTVATAVLVRVTGANVVVVVAVAVEVIVDWQNGKNVHSICELIASARLWGGFSLQGQGGVGEEKRDNA